MPPKILVVGCVSFACLFLGAGVLQPPPALGAPASLSADLYAKMSDVVVQVRLVERGTRAEAASGSGFFVAPDGWVVTNYHVVSELVLNPGRYLAEVAGKSGVSSAIQVLALDVIHDLALIRAHGIIHDKWAEVAPADPALGEKVFALGSPLGLGFFINEGTYNGVFSKAVSEKLNFTGAMEQGMSGGPAINAEGRVIGVNVQSAGNNLGFFVPARYVTRLLEQARAVRKPRSVATPEIVTQLLAAQESFVVSVLSRPWPKVRLGPFALPAQLSTAYECGSSVYDVAKEGFHGILHFCEIPDDLFVSPDHDIDWVSTEHLLMENRALNKTQLFGLFTSYFQTDWDIEGEEEDVTGFVCRTEYVQSSGMPLNTLICVRGHKKLRGLYDFVIRAVCTSVPETGLQTTMLITGVSFENGKRLLERYLREISWNR